MGHSDGNLLESTDSELKAKPDLWEGKKNKNVPSSRRTSPWEENHRIKVNKYKMIMTFSASLLMRI